MNNMKQIKILPFLIVVAFLSFGFRFVEIIGGFPQAGNAIAAGDKTEKPKEEKPKEAEHAEAKEEVSEEEPETPKWRDASDDELEFNAVNAKMFEDLRARREKVDQKERNLTTREALLRAAEQELDRKYQELTALRTELETLLNQQSEEEQAQITSLVKIYEGMKPKDAARIFDTLDLDVLVAVMGRMSERRLSPVLAAMNAERARTITIMLAEQKKLPDLPQ
ncbi:MAG: MotE family protein [Alphaproteobacteria bacterium]